MLKDITLGQYFPGETVIHRLDPRTKLTWTIIYVSALFTANSYLTYGIMLLVLVSMVYTSRIKPAVIFRGLKPLIFIVIFTAIFNLFYSEGEAIFSFWIFKISAAGITRAIFMVMRVMMLITGTLLLTYTTSPIALTDGLELILNPLKKIHVPVHELTMMMSLALRFIPSLIEETDRIMSAQKARGANFETGSLPDRARALLPLLIPLFISAFRRADELAVAMECRCYSGGEGRTRMKQLRFKRRDAFALILGAIVLGGIITLTVLGF